MPTLNANDISLHYDAFGNPNNPPLLLISASVGRGRAGARKRLALRSTSMWSPRSQGHGQIDPRTVRPHHRPTCAGHGIAWKRIDMIAAHNTFSRMGFDAIDAGLVSESWCYQPGTPAYCPDPTMEQLPSLLRRANRGRVPKNRDSSSKMLGKVVLEFSQPELVRVIRLSAGLDTFQPRSWMALVHLMFAVLRSRVLGK